MNKLYYVLVLLLLIALFRAAMIILALALVAVAIGALTLRPRSTLIFIGVLLLLCLGSAYPVVWVLALALIGAAVFWPRTPCKTEKLPQLTHH